MRARSLNGCFVFIVALLTGAVAACAYQPPPPSPSRPLPSVEVSRVPDDGIQPQACVGADGTVHLLYYKGDAAAGDLFYVKRRPNVTEWSKPLRVNSQTGSAVAMGNDRGGQIALGRDGTVHVAWNGSQKASPAGPEKSCPMLYTRLVAGKEAFEPQRCVMTASCRLDGGGSVAADDKGGVYVVWHGAPVNAKEQGETARRVFVAASSDDGATFAPEAARNDATKGVCGCCGLKACAVTDGTLLVLYRAAGDGSNRDIRLMRSTDAGKGFTDSKLDPWKLNACPMTTAAIVPTDTGVALAWETKQQIRWAIAPSSGTLPSSSEVRSTGATADVCRYPAIAVDAGAEGGACTLVAWTQGMRWNKGGELRWRLFGMDGAALGEVGVANGVPAWSLVAAVTKPGGGFLVLY